MNVPDKLDYVIKIKDLSYHYRKKEQTLFNIDLQVPKGSIYGFLGPNGSGKTTTLCIILGLLEVQKGTVAIFGKQLQANRVVTLKKIGSLIETPSLYAHLTAIENLEVYRHIFGVTNAKVGEVLEITGLAETKEKKVKQFSLGMKQRLAIALALLSSPELLILDEPSNGLDPIGFLELRELIERLNKSYGMTILVSSHILAEVEKMVSHVGIIYKGRMRFEGTLQDLYKYQQYTAELVIATSDNQKACKLLANYNPIVKLDKFILPFHNLNQVGEITKLLVDSGINVHLVHPKKKDLEQLFMDLTSDVNEFN